MKKNRNYWLASGHATLHAIASDGSHASYIVWYSPPIDHPIPKTGKPEPKSLSTIVQLDNRNIFIDRVRKMTKAISIIDLLHIM